MTHSVYIKNGTVKIIWHSRADGSEIEEILEDITEDESAKFFAEAGMSWLLTTEEIARLASVPNRIQAFIDGYELPPLGDSVNWQW